MTIFGENIHLEKFHPYIESETEHKYSLKYFVWKNETASKFKMGAVVEILLKFQIDTF